MSSLMNYFRCLSLRWKIISITALIIVIMSAVVLYFIQFQTSQITNDNLSIVLDQSIENLREESKLELNLENWKKLNQRAEKFREQDRIPVAMVFYRDPSGKLQASNPTIEAQFLRAHFTKTDKVVRFKFNGETVLGKEVDVTKDGEKLGSLGLVLSTSESQARLSQVLWWSGGLLALLAIGGLLVLYSLIGSYVVTPFRKKAMAIADGNLSSDYHENIQVGGELGQILEQTREDLSDLMGTIQEAAQETSSTANTILDSSERLKTISNQQSTQMEEASSAVTELSQSIQNVADNTRRANESGEEAREEAQQGGQDVQNAIRQMDQIEKHVMETAHKVEELGESGEQIGKIVDVISKIAEQTELLALNAAIEAARAGEQGEGFAVVADEVSRLAERVGQSAEEIEDLIEKIQKQTSESVDAMEEGTSKVKQGADVVDQAGDSLDKIVQSVSDTVEKTSQIASAMKEQATASDEVAESVEEVNQNSKKLVRSADELVDEGEKLEEIADRMESRMKKFEID